MGQPGHKKGLKDLDELLFWELPGELPGELPHLREVFEGLKSFGPPQKFSSSHPNRAPRRFSLLWEASVSLSFYRKPLLRLSDIHFRILLLPSKRPTLAPRTLSPELDLSQSTLRLMARGTYGTRSSASVRRRSNSLTKRPVRIITLNNSPHYAILM